LEIYVYEQEKNNLYVHHEIMLSAFPLSICWLNTSLESLSQAKHEKGNFAIVSSFLPEIEIWNLDVTEAVEPDLVLGGEITTNKKKPTNFKNKAKKWKEGSHTDAVLSLSLNSVNKSVLASGSADKFLKIWDLSKGRNVHSSKHHK
jgi:periodic tryptophan protein 1